MTDVDVAAEAVLGRRAELTRLAAMLDRVTTSGDAIIILGEAGVGKSTLVAALADIARARGFRVLTCAGVQGETGAGFAGLHELVAEALPHLPALPPRQAAALRSVLGLGGDDPADRLLVSLAVLGLLEELAGERPVLLVVEDAHWLDAASVQHLGFAARRLAATPVLMVATCRTGEDQPFRRFGLPETTLGGLDEDSARRLLDRGGARLPAPVRERVLAEAAGNPLALLELPRALPAAQAGAPLPVRLPQTEVLERTFAARAGDLPAACRRLLLAAAASDDGHPAELDAVAAAYGGDLGDLDPAVTAGLVRVGGRVEFRHPLVRSAVYGAATLAERREAHLALAGALAGDADRAAWHRAAAALGADEDVAAGLEAAAGRRFARGAFSAAADAAARAAELSPAEPDRARRLALAAEAARVAGRTTWAGALADEAWGIAGEPAVLVELATTCALLRVLAGVPSRGSAAHLLTVSRSLPAEQAAHLLVAAASSLLHAERLPADVVADMEQELLALDLPPDSPRRVLALAVLAPARHARALVPALCTVAQPVLQALGAPGLPAVQHRALASFTLGIASAAEALRDLPLARRACAAAADAYERSGAATDLSTALPGLARGHLAAGDLRQALACAEHAARLGRDVGVSGLEGIGLATSARVHAWRGDTAAGTAALARARELTDSLPRFLTGAEIGWASGLAALSEGRYQDARAALGVARGHTFTVSWSAADLVEATVRSGEPAEAGELLAAVEEEAASFGSARLDALLARARALVATDADAQEHFERSLAGPGAREWPLEHARTRLVYGEWLRRRRRATDAREQLHEALAAFEAAGAGAWADRARTELRASGVSVRRTGDAPGVALTEQERQIADLAAQGLSNKDIADRLFLSHRTVGAHLYRLFPKLGITSRAELRDALGRAG
ncbi:LuxR family transcriptional regulator [Kineococcus sp. NUM-3379]